MTNNPALGNLYTISAPSGAGKTSLVKQLVELDAQLCVSISHTTRTPRPGEIDGINYHFVDHAQFNEMIQVDAFLEHATVFDNHYGTSKQWVLDQLKQGKDVILEIDWQGALQAKERLNQHLCEQAIQCISIFILPPSLEALKERLTGRGQDDKNVIQKRMAAAVDEISHYEQADFLVINEQFEQALQDLQAIVRAQRLGFDKQNQRLSELIQTLLR